MSAPAMQGDRVGAILGVGNKTTDYDPSDERQLVLIAQSIWGMLSRQRANARLRASEARLRQLIWDTPDALVLLDDGRVFDLNPAAVRLFGSAKGLLVGRPLPFSRGQPPGTGSIRRADGAQRDVEVRDSRIEIDGKPIDAVFLYDVTRRRELERQLADAQRLEGIGRLAAGVAHEINTPIQFIGDNLDYVSGSIDALLAQTTHDDADDLRAALTDAHEGVRRVSEIVGAMKMFAHRGLGDDAPCDLRAHVSAAAVVCRSVLRGVAYLELAMSEDLPPVAANAGELNQVWLNLLVNAAQAIAARPEGSPPGHIAIIGSLVDGMVEILILDNGGGIPADVAPHVFEPFFTTKPVGQGTGQGLAIAWHVIAKHHGTLTFETTPGEGTAFIVRLPPFGARAERGDHPPTVGPIPGVAVEPW